MKPELFLFEFPEGRMVGDWRHSLEKRADQSPLEYDIRHHRLRLWDPHATAMPTPRPDIRFRNGLEIQRVDLGGQRTRTTIGISMCRLYFEDGSNMPVVESQAELFKPGQSPEVPKHLKFLQEARALLETFNSNDPILTPLAGIIHYDVSDSVSFQFGAGESVRLSEMVRDSYSKSILAHIRNRPAYLATNFCLALLPLFCRDREKAKTAATAFSNVLQNEWRCNISKAIVESPEQLEQWKHDSANRNRIALIVLDGKKGDRPSQDALDWMTSLAEEGIPFQLCSSQSPTNYSRHGTACSILAKTGGLLYRVGCSSVPDLGEHWCIGIDLGLGGEYQNKVAVITLTDGSGKLHAFWRALKDLDETLPEDLLRDGLGWIIGKANSIASDRKFLVFRDGLRPQNESLEVYLDLIPKEQSTVIELSKTGNPLYVFANTAPLPGSHAIAPESDRTFLYPATAPQNDVLNNAVKIFCPHNALNYTRDQLCEITTALCHAPTLSFQPSSLPAPIYWADGLASLSHSNLQFGGWSHLPNQLRDLRPARE